MPLTEAKRRANNKYIAKNYTVLGCKIRKDKAEAFKELCKERQTSPNELFTIAINEFISGEKELDPHIIPNAISWLSAHGHTDAEISDFLNAISNK